MPAIASRLLASVLLVGGLVTLRAAATQAQPPGPGAVTAITPLEANARVDRGAAVLVDVREADEVALGMALPARWLPKSRLDADPDALSSLLRSVPLPRELIFYCARGRRAQVVAELAAAQGRAVRNMGRYQDWVTAGLPIKRGPGSVRTPGHLDLISGRVLRVEPLTSDAQSDVRAILRVGRGQLAVRLGPAWFVLGQTMQLSAADRVLVQGSSSAADGAVQVIAVEIRRGSERLRLRDDDGAPLWSRR